MTAVFDELAHGFMTFNFILLTFLLKKVKAFLWIKSIDESTVIVARGTQLHMSRLNWGEGFI